MGRITRCIIGVVPYCDKNGFCELSLGKESGEVTFATYRSTTLLLDKLSLEQRLHGKDHIAIYLEDCRDQSSDYKTFGWRWVTRAILSSANEQIYRLVSESLEEQEYHVTSVPSMKYPKLGAAEIYNTLNKSGFKSYKILSEDTQSNACSLALYGYQNELRRSRCSPIKPSE